MATLAELVADRSAVAEFKGDDLWPPGPRVGDRLNSTVGCVARNAPL
jgi:hypothetical protein